MGMYTEIFVSCRIKNDPIAVAVLKYMLRMDDYLEIDAPNHPLFKTTRWPHMLIGSSYYFVPRSLHLFEYDDIGKYWCFISRSDLKNYEQEIEHFIDWIRPYVEDAEEMIGYSRYEESKEPTIYYS